MNPSEYKTDKPDIMALFNDSLITQVQHLQKNDLISFECTFIQISRNKDPHTCFLWNIVLLKKYKNEKFNVMNFVKHMSIFDIINNNTNLNPFFIHSKGNIPESEIIHPIDKYDLYDTDSNISDYPSDSIKVINLSSTIPEVSGVMVNNEYIVNVDTDDIDAISNITELNYINPNQTNLKQVMYKQVLNDMQLNDRYKMGILYDELHDDNEDMDRVITMDNKLKLALKGMIKKYEHREVLNLIDEKYNTKHNLKELDSSYMDVDLLNTIYDNDDNMSYFNEEENEFDSDIYESLLDEPSSDSFNFLLLNKPKKYNIDDINFDRNINISNYNDNKDETDNIDDDNVYENKNSDTSENSTLYDRIVEKEQASISEQNQNSNEEKSN